MKTASRFAIPAGAARAVRGDKCRDCNGPAEFVFGRETKKKWCASGTYVTRGNPFCRPCYETASRKQEEELAAYRAHLAMLKARREEKRSAGIPLTDEDYDC